MKSWGVVAPPPPPPPPSKVRHNFTAAFFLFLVFPFVFCSYSDLISQVELQEKLAKASMIKFQINAALQSRSITNGAGKQFSSEISVNDSPFRLVLCKKATHDYVRLCPFFTLCAYYVCIFCGLSGDPVVVTNIGPLLSPHLSLCLFVHVCV